MVAGFVYVASRYVSEGFAGIEQALGIIYRLAAKEDIPLCHSQK